MGILTLRTGDTAKRRDGDGFLVRRFAGSPVRRLLLFSCAAVFLLAAIIQSQQTSIPENWPQFRGNLALTGVAKSVLPPSLKVAWTYEAGEPIESSAAIANGAVYVGTQSAELLALDLKTGKLLWKYKTTEGIGESSPCVADGIVYVGDLAGVFHAVGTDGKGLWTFKTGSEIKASPVVVGDRVLIGSYDETLYCLAAKTGKLLWQFKINGPVHCTVSVANGIAYVSGCDEVFRAIRISDGKEVYNVSSGAYTGASPALQGPAAYFGTFSNEVLSVNLQSRQLVWRYENKQRQFPFYSSAALAEGKVVLGGRDKLVHCLNASTGKLVWTFTTRARVDSSPAVAVGRVYIGSNDGRFYVLELATGAKVWEFEAGAALSASPAIAGGRVVIGSQDGRLYCFG
ncbi:MAG: PQQ-binding-like beta-propeller repeat protein [Acidobacteria bacterium]|nr:PQQ-binding-like beta-propeller repeat protein [Acidobacteriota bacterium]MCI0721474.1 PQQ-binding-like beta-propeller repeat protein [Acidobacteriota bacterium]